jgi:hypothetical protein
MLEQINASAIVVALYCYYRIPNQSGVASWKNLLNATVH